MKGMHVQKSSTPRSGGKLEAKTVVSPIQVTPPSKPGKLKKVAKEEKEAKEAKEAKETKSNTSFSPPACTLGNEEPKVHVKYEYKDTFDTRGNRQCSIRRIIVTVSEFTKRTDCEDYNLRYGASIYRNTLKPGMTGDFLPINSKNVREHLTATAMARFKTNPIVIENVKKEYMKKFPSSKRPLDKLYQNREFCYVLRKFIFVCGTGGKKKIVKGKIPFQPLMFLPAPIPVINCSTTKELTRSQVVDKSKDTSIPAGPWTSPLEVGERHSWPTSSGEIHPWTSDRLLAWRRAEVQGLKS